MAQLLAQSSEVLHNIFKYVDSTDLAALSMTCHFLRDTINSDDLLWKIHYLNIFDQPVTNIEEGSWHRRLTKLVTLSKLLESEDEDVKRDCLEQVATDSINLMTNSVSDPTKNAEFLTQHFSKEINISAYLCRSSLFMHSRFEADKPAETEELCQLSAKLHVLYGLEVEPDPEELCQSTARHVHPYARSRVYDLRRYTENNLWGPFTDDGSQSIDWEKVQAIMIDLSYNLRMYTERRSDSSSGGLWDQAFHGIAPNSYISNPLSGKLVQPLHPDLDVLDPYGVTGTWMRIVCFLDYNDLFAFNFESGLIPLNQERDPISTREAFRLIRLQLQVTKIEEPGQEDGQDMPVVHFTGSSKSTYMSWDLNANSRIRGTVRTTPSGAIRWTTFSIFHGEERWRSEGVQIGGIRSARGILGNWFDKDYDRHGPAGPTAFWKVSDDIVEDKKPSGITPWQEIVSVVFES